MHTTGIRSSFWHAKSLIKNMHIIKSCYIIILYSIILSTKLPFLIFQRFRNLQSNLVYLYAFCVVQPKSLSLPITVSFKVMLQQSN